jgi:pSer/pThr/pTyr-binding forkhead associated (FHA) protein
VFELRDRSDVRIVIGRNSPDLKLNDIMISRHHARLKYDGKRWILRDLGSRNGTKLNGDLLRKPTVLKTGDLIGTGYTEFAVRLEAEDDPEDALPPSWQHHDDDEESPLAAGASHADVAGAASSGFIPAAVASGEIDRPPQPPAAVKPPPPVNPDTVGAGSSGYVPAALASGEIEKPAPSVVPPAARAAVAVGDAPASSVPHPEPKVAKTGEHAPVPSSEPVITRQFEPGPVATVTPSISISASSVAPEDVPPREPDASMAVEQVTPVAPPAPWLAAAASTEAPVPRAAIPALLGERPASEWMNAISSQLIVVNEQGWDDLADDEDDGFINAIEGDLSVEPLDDDERSLLYFDEDEHWADDLPLDDDEMINSLKEDGPDALLRELAQRASTPGSASAVREKPLPAPAEPSGEPPTGGKLKKKRKK